MNSKTEPKFKEVGDLLEDEFYNESGSGEDDDDDGEEDDDSEDEDDVCSKPDVDGDCECEVCMFAKERALIGRTDAVQKQLDKMYEYSMSYGFLRLEIQGKIDHDIIPDWMFASGFGQGSCQCKVCVAKRKVLHKMMIQCVVLSDHG